MTHPKRESETHVVAWHALPEAEVLARLKSSRAGLDLEEVATRQKEVGKNILPSRKAPSLGAVFLRQFLSPLIYVLLAAGSISLAIGEITDAIFIFAVVLINACISTCQEWKAEKDAIALQRLLTVYARVRRDGVENEVPAEELVPGDIVFLEPGNRVPADLRLVEATGLMVDESLLTGESVPVEKKTDRLAEDLVVSERTNMVFAGTTVVAGRAMGVVVATGMATEVGRIAQAVALEEAAKPPLVLRMERFSKQVGLATLGACALLSVVAIAKGIPYTEVFFRAVALAVSALPEGLPVAITVALSVSTIRMLRRNVVVRRLTAVEALGSCTLIASDKTGTLTVNKQTVKIVSLPPGKRLVVTGEGYVGEGEVRTETGDAVVGPDRLRLLELAKAGVLCNEAGLFREGGEWKHYGDAVDVALLALGYKLGLDPETVRREAVPVGEIPFEPERRYAARFYQEGGRVWVAVKGAVETVLPFCRSMLTEEGPVAISREAVEREAVALSKGGYRVLAIAHGEVDLSASASFDEKHMPPLTFLGLVGLIDPLRREVRPAVELCRQAGIEVVMITGDHPATALTIARELGIADSRDDVITGSELAEAGPPENPAFLEVVRRVRVFARVTPLQKLQIVEALKRIGHFVAVTGDGVNDVPALRKANIGVAMGSGTDVAKDTASIIVTNDNFASIVAGVEEGRFAYDNIRKVVYLLISTGAAEVVLFTLALVFNLPLPLLAVQLLWLNLVTNGIQDVALAMEAGEPGAMLRPPRRPNEGIFNQLMIQQTLVSGMVMGLVAFAAWFWMLHAGWDETAARNLLLLLMVLLENFHVFNCRSEYTSAFKVPLRRNPVLVAGVFAAQGIHVLAMYVPFLQTALRISPVALAEWGQMFLLASLVLVAMEIFKLIRRRWSSSVPQRL